MRDTQIILLAVALYLAGICIGLTRHTWQSWLYTAMAGAAFYRLPFLVFRRCPEPRRD